MKVYAGCRSELGSLLFSNVSIDIEGAIGYLLLFSMDAGEFSDALVPSAARRVMHTHSIGVVDFNDSRFTGLLREQWSSTRYIGRGSPIEFTFASAYGSLVAHLAKVFVSSKRPFTEFGKGRHR